MSTITFTAARQAGDSTATPISIPFDVVGTATYNVDYTVAGANTFSATAGTMTIPAGQSSASMIFTLLVFGSPQPQRTIDLIPTQQNATWRNGRVAWTTTILADPLPAILSLDFEQLTPIDGSGKLVTVNGGYAQSTFAYSGGYAGQFNGSNAWLLLQPNSDWNFGEVTIQCYVRLSVIPTGTFYPNVFNIIHHGRQNTGQGYNLVIESQHLNFQISDTAIVRGLHGMSTGVYYKIAYTRQLIGGTSYYHRLFVNDIKIAESISSTILDYDGGRGLTIGSEEYGNGAFFNGQIDNLDIFPNCIYI